MLIQFSLGNFLSFNKVQTISMLAAPGKELKEDNVFYERKYSLLKNCIVYGSNASGKSNLLLGMRFMRNFVLNSHKETQIGDEIPVTRFMLSKKSINEPSFFEVVMIINNYKFRYGFEVTNKIIISEWLFRSDLEAKTSKEAALFKRIKDEIEIGSYFKEANGLEKRTRENTLFLSYIAQNNGEISSMILGWFRDFNVISGIDDIYYERFSASLLEKSETRKRVMDFVKIADPSIEDVIVDIVKDKNIFLKENMPTHVREAILNSNNFEAIKIDSQHLIHGTKKKEFVNFNFLDSESAGTKKIFNLSGPIIDTLEKGKVLVIDEIDAKLHPVITKFLIKLFNSKETNPNKAQLICTTHDVNLLNSQDIRRDQIWFTEKNDLNETDLFSLVEYKPRKDTSLEKGYIAGRYGAIPYVDFNLFAENKNE